MTEYAAYPRRKCPRCGSPKPEHHPAVQFEGEVETCIDDFHLIETAGNRPEYIAAVHAKREAPQDRGEKEKEDGRPFGQPAGALRAEPLSGVSGKAAHQAQGEDQ